MVYFRFRLNGVFHWYFSGNGKHGTGYCITDKQRLESIEELIDQWRKRS